MESRIFGRQYRRCTVLYCTVHIYIRIHTRYIISILTAQQSIYSTYEKHVKLLNRHIIHIHSADTCSYISSIADLTPLYYRKSYTNDVCSVSDVRSNEYILYAVIAIFQQEKNKYKSFIQIWCLFVYLLHILYTYL